MSDLVIMYTNFAEFLLFILFFRMSFGKYQGQLDELLPILRLCTRVVLVSDGRLFKQECNPERCAPSAAVGRGGCLPREVCLPRGGVSA